MASGSDHPDEVLQTDVVTYLSSLLSILSIASCASSCVANVMKAKPRCLELSGEVSKRCIDFSAERI